MSQENQILRKKLAALDFLLHSEVMHAFQYQHKELIFRINFTVATGYPGGF